MRGSDSRWWIVSTAILIAVACWIRFAPVSPRDPLLEVSDSGEVEGGEAPTSTKLTPSNEGALTRIANLVTEPNGDQVRTTPTEDEPTADSTGWLLIVHLDPPPLTKAAVADVRVVGQDSKRGQARITHRVPVDAEGRLEISLDWLIQRVSDTPPEPFEVAVDVGGLLVATGFADPRDAQIETRSGQRLHIIEVHLKSEAVALVRGKIVSPEGSPQTEVPVGLFRVDGGNEEAELLVQTTTGPAGSYRLQTSHGGELVIAAVGNPWRPWTDRVLLVPGSVLDLGEIRLERGATLSGVVKGSWAGRELYLTTTARFPKGQYLLDVYAIRVNGLFEFGHRIASTAADGSFVIEGLSPDVEYILYPRGGANGCRMAGLHGGSEVLAAPAEGLELSFNETVLHLIVSSSGAPVGEVMANLYEVDELQTVCRTGNDGHAIMVVAPGRAFTLEVTKPSFVSERLDVISPGTGEWVVVPVDLQLVRDPGSIRLSLRDSSGRSIPRTFVELFAEGRTEVGPSADWRFQVNLEDGTGQIPDVSPGRYHMCIREREQLGSMYLPVHQLIEVLSGRETRAEATIERGGRVALQVVDSKGALVDVVCRVFTSTGDPVKVTYVFRDPAKGTVAQDSNRPHPNASELRAYAELEDAIAPGDYRVEVVVNDEIVRTKSFTVAVGELCRVTVEIP